MKTWIIELVMEIWEVDELQLGMAGDTVKEFILYCRLKMLIGILNGIYRGFGGKFGEMYFWFRVGVNQDWVSDVFLDYFYFYLCVLIYY